MPWAVGTVAGMSEQGWRAFLAGDRVDDWVVLHGGPTAVFKVGSLGEAARLAAAVAEIPGLGPCTLLTAASDRLTVKLTREMWGTADRSGNKVCLAAWPDGAEPAG